MKYGLNTGVGALGASVWRLSVVSGNVRSMTTTPSTIHEAHRQRRALQELMAVKVGDE